MNQENEQQFLISRRTVRLWPIGETGGLDKGVKQFMRDILKMPAEIVESLVFEEVKRMPQTRRSKIQGEILVRLATSQQRDVVQSYASNLAAVQGRAGMRLDIPDFLRGLFRLFEEHAANLKTRYSQIRRAVRFDDVERSLYMDIKIEEDEWQRITAADIREIDSRAKIARSKAQQDKRSTAKSRRRALLLDEETEQDYPRVESDDDESERMNGRNAAE